MWITQPNALSSKSPETRRWNPDHLSACLHRSSKGAGRSRNPIGSSAGCDRDGRSLKAVLLSCSQPGRGRCHDDLCQLLHRAVDRPVLVALQIRKDHLPQPVFSAVLILGVAAVRAAVPGASLRLEVLQLARETSRRRRTDHRPPAPSPLEHRSPEGPLEDGR